jgi:dienelactone hydrolase
VYCARIEIHMLDTTTLTNRQFLTGSEVGARARIGAELRLPPGTDRIPAVVLLHGSGGIGANVNRWGQELNAVGIGALLLDCFTGRGITQTLANQSQLGHLSMIVDAYHALNLLANHSRINSKKIAVMGFSKGGSAALYASLKRFQKMHGPAGAEFCAHIAFYPQCNTTYFNDENISDHPVQLFHGTGDDYVSIEPARGYVERLRRVARRAQLKEYRGAHHAFDNPTYSPARYLPDAVSTSNCTLRERAGGEIENAQTGRAFSWNDECIKVGATVGYDPDAAADATRTVKELLSSWFRLVS